jgi:hypothetical protein
LDKVDEGALLAKNAQSWPRLRHLRRLAPEDEGLEAFLAGDLVPRLEGLELILPVRPTSRSPVAGFVRLADRLRRLDLIVGRSETDYRPLLVADLLPQLRELSLTGSSFTEGVPEVLLRVADEPIFARIRHLHLEELPEALVLGIFARDDLRLERLELHNRFYIRNLVPRQQYACRLTPEGVAAIARSGTLGDVTHLSIVNERVGDEILELVAATEPGRLRTLELVNVELTDAGVARLATMPQLASVACLNLQQNPITAPGIATLVASPHLGNLQQLDLGSGEYNPYYGGGYCDPQALGDDGAEAVAVSGLVSQLKSLSLRFAQIGPQGVTALCRLGSLPRLHRLDLSENPLGVDGVRPFAGSALLDSVRQLDLSICKLDDVAIANLGRTDLGRLRALDLAYNSIGPRGATRLATAAPLANLWRLNLHDNLIGDDGLIALARSSVLGQLVELDLEQDVWNYRSAPFAVEAVRAIASSPTFARLDSLFVGIVDEYHGGRYRPPLAKAAREAVRTSVVLRGPVRHGVDAFDAESDADPLEREPLEFVYHYMTPREQEQSRRRHDFRRIPPLESRMSEEEWCTNEDPGWMLEFLGENTSTRKLRLFACVCARRALRLRESAPLEEVVGKAEQFADDEIPWAECEAAERVVSEIQPEQDSLEESVLYSALNTVRDNVHMGARCSAELAVRAVIARAFADRPCSVYSGVYLPEHGVQAALLRCIFGPYPGTRAGRVDGSWLSAKVVALAREIYERRAFELLPAFADALEEAGCDDANILAHCREEGSHTRGCWVVDLVLGKE